MSPAAAGPMPSAAGGELRLRVISGLVLAALALGAAWLGGWPAAVGLAIVAGLVFREWAGITVPTADPLLVAALAIASAVPVLIAGAGWPAPAIVLALAVGFAAALLGRHAWLGGGPVYAAALGVSLVLLRAAPDMGLAAALFVLAVVWISDTAAYFTGRALGGPKLWPRVSPKKTWSGAIGGAVGGVAAGIAVTAVAGVSLTWALAAVALALAIVSQAGDLLESAIKRRFAVKDASGLIPGHGGLMDRVDGLTTAAVAAALIGWAHGGADHLATGLLSW